MSTRADLAPLAKTPTCRALARPAESRHGISRSAATGVVGAASPSNPRRSRGAVARRRRRARVAERFGRADAGDLLTSAAPRVPVARDQRTVGSPGCGATQRSPGSPTLVPALGGGPDGDLENTRRGCPGITAVDPTRTAGPVGNPKPARWARDRHRQVRGPPDVSWRVAAAATCCGWENQPARGPVWRGRGRGTRTPSREAGAVRLPKCPTRTRS